MFGQVRQDQIRAYRGDGIEPRLAELAFDVVFLGKAETTVGLHTHVSSSPADSVPVQYVMVDDVPVVTLVRVNVLLTAFQAHVGALGPVKPAVISVAALLKLVAVARLIELEVFATPSMVTLIRNVLLTTETVASHPAGGAMSWSPSLPNAPTASASPPSTDHY